MAMARGSGLVDDNTLLVALRCVTHASPSTAKIPERGHVKMARGATCARRALTIPEDIMHRIVKSCSFSIVLEIVPLNVLDPLQFDKEGTDLVRPPGPQTDTSLRDPLPRHCQRADSHRAS